MRRALPLSTLFLILLFPSIIFSQNSVRKNAVVWRANWVNFQMPITDELSIDDYTTGMELTYVRYLNQNFNFSVPLKVAKARLPLDELGNTEDTEVILGLDALVHIKFINEKSWFQPYLLGGVGAMAETADDVKVNPEFPFGFGINFRVGRGIYLSGETQYRVDLSDNRNHLSHATGLWFVLNKKSEEEKEVTDADMDGIPDDEDQCPNEAGEASLFGCPDSDGDGVANRLDKCPEIAGLATLSGCPDDDGDGVANHVDECPTLPGDPDNAGCPNNDRDGDGVPNDADRCPDKPGSEYADGCPDLDADGIPDIDDTCPTVSGLPENKGCPDSDGDRVADPFDKCPETPGTIANSGCPELEPKEKEVLDFAMQAVQFETGSARLKPESNSVLDQIAEILGKYPEQKLRISGHTDSIGSSGNNLKLSKLRAMACFDYLVSVGIDANRMTYRGFGETQPIGDNRYADGREKNRRVEFEIYAN